MRMTPSGFHNKIEGMRKGCKELGSIGENLRGIGRVDRLECTLPGGPESQNPVIYTLPGVGQGLAPPEICGPPQGQVARDFLEVGALLARGHQAGEVEGDQFWGAQEARLQIQAGLSRDD